MSMQLKERPTTETVDVAEEQARPEKKRQKKARYPQKRTMNLFYKPDRTTKPATVALYVLFVLVCLLGLSKFLVYDIWMEKVQAQQALAAAENELNSVMIELSNYNEVKERYQRYSATDEERELIDRMEVFDLLDSAVGSMAEINTISLSGNTVQIQFSGVTLAQTAEIVHKLEASPIVESIMVSTASTTKEADVPIDESSPVQANAMINLHKEVAE